MSGIFTKIPAASHSSTVDSLGVIDLLRSVDPTTELPIGMDKIKGKFFLDFKNAVKPVENLAFNQLTKTGAVSPSITAASNLVAEVFNGTPSKTSISSDSEPTTTPGM